MHIPPSALRRYQVHYALGDGGTLTLRAIRPTDKAALRALFRRLSPASMYNRFCAARSELTDTELDFFTDVDFDNHVALAATLSQEGSTQLVGVGRYILCEAQAESSAELALTVDQAHQGMGIGRRLLAALIDLGRSSPLCAFSADVLAHNHAMLALLDGCGLPMQRKIQCGTWQLSLALPQAS